jgi:transcriptional regulator with XRE-family HTH domain
MRHFKEGSRSVLARAVSAEVRARMGARRMSQREFAEAVGFLSHNYVAIRNRDEKPYTLDDIELICSYFNEDPQDFIRRAMESHADDVFAESMAATVDPGLAEMEEGLSRSGRRALDQAEALEAEREREAERQARESEPEDPPEHGEGEARDSA